MIIDAHGHFTTAPEQLATWRQRQVDAFEAGTQPPDPGDLQISDDEIRASLEANQLKQMRERGSDLTIFSPRASFMAHHLGDAGVSAVWASLCNELVHRVTRLYPDNFAGAAMLPQSPGTDVRSCLEELERCVETFGFVGVNLNLDPSGGFWNSPPLDDPYWFPIYEALVAYDIPAMIHVSTSANSAFYTTGSHYLNADTTAFMQLLSGDLFATFPSLRIIIPHGGGGVPYHWGRFRGLAQMLGKPALEDHLLGNVFFDTCVYHQAGIDLLTRVVPLDNLLFASEMIGAVRGIDPETGRYFDDTKQFVDVAITDEGDRHRIYELNARRVFPRLDARLKAMG